jgi:hypothetical protein
MFAVQTATEAGWAKGASLATVLHRQFVHEGRQQPSQGWYTGSTPVALPMLITYEIAFQKRILATT